MPLIYRRRQRLMPDHSTPYRFFAADFGFTRYADAADAITLLPFSPLPPPPMMPLLLALFASIFAFIATDIIACHCHVH